MMSRWRERDNDGEEKDTVGQWGIAWGNDEEKGKRAHSVGRGNDGGQGGTPGATTTRRQGRHAMTSFGPKIDDRGKHENDAKKGRGNGGTKGGHRGNKEDEGEIGEQGARGTQGAMMTMKT